MDTYEITIIDNFKDHNTWTLMFHAEDFGHAEEQAKPYIGDDEFIWKIEYEPKEY